MNARSKSSVTGLSSCGLCFDGGEERPDRDSSEWVRDIGKWHSDGECYIEVSS